MSQSIGADSNVESSSGNIAVSTTALQHRHKRHQVARACSACRAHRTKCDDNPICQRCKSRGSQCSNSNVSKCGNLSEAHMRIEHLTKELNDLRRSAQPRQIEENYNDIAAGVLEARSDKRRRQQYKPWQGVFLRSSRSQHEIWYGPSSMVYYIDRVTKAMSRRLNIELVTAIKHPSEVHDLLNESISSRGGSIDAAVYLNSTQEEYFVALFWQAFHTSLLPILNEADFKEHHQSLWLASDDTTRKPSALVDIVIAMCMQYGISMLPFAKQSKLIDNKDAAIAGRWHYRRCQMLLAYELEHPSISTLQSHLLCCVYLCSGNFQSMADSMCGVAARIAYMLGLHLEPSSALSLKERELRKRLWWALYTLDSKIGMKLGRPFLLHDSLIPPSLPGDHTDAASVSGSHFALLGKDTTWLSFSLQHTKLFKIARNAHKAFFEQDIEVHDNQTMWESTSTMEFLAESLSSHLLRLQEWVELLPEVLKTKRESDGTSFSTDTSPLSIEEFSPLWLQRQRLILELVYHNLALNLLRPFISMPTATTPTPYQRNEAHWCAAHAVQITHIMHQVLSSTDILDGWHEAFQWQWNAAMTLIGFTFAESLRDDRLQASSSVAVITTRSALNLSINVFDVFGKNFLGAASAAVIIRDLCARIDTIKKPNDHSNKNSVEDLSLARNSLLNEGLEANLIPNGSFDFDFDLPISMPEQHQNVLDYAMILDLWGDPGSL